MKVKKTTEQFIKDSIEINGERYDYSKVNYQGAHSKIKIICPQHGDFIQAPTKHLTGHGCQKCGGSFKHTTETIVERFINTHNNRYDYSKVIYVGSHTKVDIICQEHGVFSQTPFSHIGGSGCPKCGDAECSEKLIERASETRNWDFEQPEEYKLIPLGRNKYAKIDNEDFDKLKDINWYCSGKYVKHNKLGHIHRLIMNPPDNLVVDHINGDGLDNRRGNLRICTQQENNWNINFKTGVSNYIGVTWVSGMKKWKSQINYKNKYIHIGYFENTEEAAKAYDLKAIELHGEFARLNFPKLKEEYLNIIRGGEIWI